MWFSLTLALAGIFACLTLLYIQRSLDLRHTAERELKGLGRTTAVLLAAAGIDIRSGVPEPGQRQRLTKLLDELLQHGCARRIAVILSENDTSFVVAEGRAVTGAPLPPLLLTDEMNPLVRGLRAGSSLCREEMDLLACLLPLATDPRRRLDAWIEAEPCPRAQRQARPLLLFALLGGGMVLCLLLPLYVFWRMDRSLQQARRDELEVKERERKEAVSHLIETNEDLRRQFSARLRTERQLQASEGRFRALVETTCDFVWEVDRECRYVYASPKVYDILGYRPEELLGRATSAFLTVEEAVRLQPICHDITTGKRPFSSLVKTCLHKNGSRVVLETGGEPVLDNSGQLQGYRGIDRDITVRKQEEQLLRDAKERAELADRAKSAFLANMSHELRTPLHAILSFSSFGLKKLAHADKEDLGKYFAQINNSGKRLLPLINSLLDLSKLESGKIVYQTSEQDLRPTIEGVLAELGLLAEQKHIDLLLTPPLIDAGACFDAERIGQVLRNLLANALRLTGEGKRISITLTEGPPRELDGEAMLCITVADQGVGVPPAELESIFKPFAQSSNTQSAAGGTGLGLAICRRIVDDHGGHIWASNNEDGGASFSFTLPRHCLRNIKLGELLVQRGLITMEHLQEALAHQDKTREHDRGDG
ncbi:MAG: hypothetical protein BWK76_02015 [Desulfobulbaceae bacterium A2]|nr:MAG: hypothetical protein BWK76_02015 [Desulfobulbaceae bacterium A2]